MTPSAPQRAAEELLERFIIGTAHKDASKDEVAAIIRKHYAPLIEAAELTAQRLESLEPVHLNWHLATGEIARALRKAIAEAKWE